MKQDKLQKKDGMMNAEYLYQSLSFFKWTWM